MGRTGIIPARGTADQGAMTGIRISAVFAGALLALACTLVSAQWGGRLPDPVQFGVRIEMGDIAQAREWLDRGLDPDFIGDRIGTGLMIAAWEGNLPMMQLFVSRGADVNKSNVLGEQAVMHAAWRGKLEAMNWLLQRGARINSGPRQWSALHYAAFAGHGDAVRELVSRGADINARSTTGSSPLMMAVYEGRDATVKQLIALGSDPGVKNDYGEGALEWAFKHNHLGIARMVGTAQEFAAAANLAKSKWGPSIRSLPAAEAPLAQAKPVQRTELEDLLNVRAILVSKGMTSAVATLDKKIAVLRAAKGMNAGTNTRTVATPAAVLEISASRKAPEEQKTRRIIESGSHRRGRD